MMVYIYVVTGANRGLGLEFAKQILLNGNKVHATARDISKAHELQQLMTDYPRQLYLHELDVEDDISVKTFLGSMHEVDHIDVLINNAGSYLDKEGFTSLDFQKLERMFRINTMGAMKVTRALQPQLALGPNPKLVHISSKMGSIGDNTSGGSYSYRMSKAALNMFNKCFSIDYPDIISVVMHPGWVQTDMGGPNGLITAKESVDGMISEIKLLTKEDSGKFIQYNGNEVPW